MIENLNKDDIVSGAGLKIFTASSQRGVYRKGNFTDGYSSERLRMEQMVVDIKLCTGQPRATSNYTAKSVVG